MTKIFRPNNTRGTSKETLNTKTTTKKLSNTKKQVRAITLANAQKKRELRHYPGGIKFQITKRNFSFKLSRRRTQINCFCHDLFADP